MIGRGAAARQALGLGLQIFRYTLGVSGEFLEDWTDFLDMAFHIF